jgi:transcriptional regulator of acetoin/glycerol metabolism
VRSSLDRNSAALERNRALPAADDERNAILAALEVAGGSRSRAAEILGMGRTTLWRKLKQYPAPEEG